MCIKGEVTHCTAEAGCGATDDFSWSKDIGGIAGSNVLVQASSASFRRNIYADDYIIFHSIYNSLEIKMLPTPIWTPSHLILGQDIISLVHVMAGRYDKMKLLVTGWDVAHRMLLTSNRLWSFPQPLCKRFIVTREIGHLYTRSSFCD